MARYSPPKAWFYLKKRQSMGMGLGDNVYPGRTRPDDALGGGSNAPGQGVSIFDLRLDGQPLALDSSKLRLKD